MKCPKCKSQQPEEYQFCPLCGTALVANNLPFERETQGDTAVDWSVTSIDQKIHHKGIGPMIGVDLSRVGDTGLSRNTVIIQQRIINISPDSVHFTVFDGETRLDPIFPKYKNELGYLIQVGDKAKVEGFIHAPRALIVGDEVVLTGPVYAHEKVQIGKRCTIQSHIISSGSIQIGQGTSVIGCVCSNNAHLLEVDDNCSMIGILAQGNVVLGKGVRLKFISTSGNVVLDSDCLVDWIDACDVQVGVNGHIKHITARGNLSLGSATELDSFVVGGHLSLGPSVKIRTMDTLVGKVFKLAFPLRLGDKVVTTSNAFTWSKERIAPFEEADKSTKTAREIIITSLLDHDLLKMLKSVTGLELSIPTVINKHKGRMK